MQASREREQRAWAVKVIKRFIKGFMSRKQPVSVNNAEYLTFVRLKENLPKNLLAMNTWLTPPSIMQQVY
ncbi:hypothetical protein GN956_G25778 [Arapaima gigas]